MTEKENEIKSKLMEKFKLPETAIRVQRKLRIYADIDLPRYDQIIEYAKKSLGFDFVTSMTGLDEVENFGIIYHMTQLNGGIVLSLKVKIPKNDPKTSTITASFPGVDIFEREITDLFGIVFDGLPKGNRYPLTDDWPKGQFPLRKDWKTLDGQAEGDTPCQV